MAQRNADLNRLLSRFIMNKVQLREGLKREALNCWQIVSRIVNEVQRVDRRFTITEIPGRLKIKERDQFDIMLEMNRLELDVPPYGDSEDDGLNHPPAGFTRVMCADGRRMLNGTQVNLEFSRMVGETIGQLHLERIASVEFEGPAVTLTITNNERVYSVDLTLAIKDFTWPEDANEWRTRRGNGWPSQQLVDQICEQGCHLVAKRPTNFRGPNDQTHFFWRLSFSAAEKRLFREAIGEATTFHKQVLRILKCLREDLHMQPLKSYHLRTILLYECEANPAQGQWQSSHLAARFRGALERLEHCLAQRNCPHYFIANLNLFEEFNPQRCQELQGIVHNIMDRPDLYIVP